MSCKDIVLFAGFCGKYLVVSSAHKNSVPEGCQGAKKSVCSETGSRVHRGLPTYSLALTLSRTSRYEKR